METTSSGCLTRRFASSEMWMRPSSCRPMSTKAPKSVMLRTVPRRMVPGLSSESLTMAWRVSGAGRSARGSRPGLTRASRMSWTVGAPACSAAASSRSLRSSKRRRLSFMRSSCSGARRSCSVKPSFCRIFSASAYDSGWTGVLSSGDLAPWMRRKPAHCVKAAGPRRGTFRSSRRLVKTPCSLR